jgi:hypothetical protein
MYIGIPSLNLAVVGRTDIVGYQERPLSLQPIAHERKKVYL